MTSIDFGSALPKHISRYEIVREIGRGGMAVVYLAHDPNFKRDVAIKVLPQEALDNKTLYERFLREAQTIASLDHSAIVPVYDFGNDNGQPFLVMRYLSGGSLASRLKSGPLPLTDASKILHRIGGALDAAHAKGIVHRDLKPGNILFDQNGDAYLGDFGIAQLSSATSPLTGSAVVGTPSYMSPEQIRGGTKLDGRSDIYALGIVLFEMLTGTLPYKADTPAQVMMMQLANPTPRPSELRGDLPEPVNNVIVRAMAKDVEFRFPKASDMEAALRAAASGGNISLVDENIPSNSGKETGFGTYDALDTGGIPPENNKGDAVPKGSQNRNRLLSFSLIGILAVCICIGSTGVGGYVLFSRSAKVTAVEQSFTRIMTSGSVTPIHPTIPPRFPTITNEMALGTTTEPDLGGVPSPTQLIGDVFQINIDPSFEISNGVPGPGAGNIETPGAHDIYSFTATADQSIYIQNIKIEMLDDLYMQIVNADTGKQVSDYKIYMDEVKSGYMSDWGVINFPAEGTYDLIVGNTTIPSTGVYKIKIWNVPETSAFPININPSFEISNGVPGPGAGNIETPGVKDKYSFTITAGQSIFIQNIKLEMSGDIYMEIINDETGKKVSDYKIYMDEVKSGYMSDWGVINFPAEGTYDLIVGNTTIPSTGVYKIKIWNVPETSAFPININPSFEISNGVPGPGAGNIETPGVKDKYSFTITAGQSIYIQNIKIVMSGDIYMEIINDETGKKVSDYKIYMDEVKGGYMSDWGVISFPSAGTYILIIGNTTIPSTGTYAVKIWGQGSPQK